MYQDLVEQTTTTTGTGSYALGAGPAGRRTFADAYTAGNAGIPYVVTDDAGNYECGIGKFNAGVLERSVVLSSSNANAAVSWAAGTKRIYVSPHAAMMLSSYRQNLNQIPVPTAAPNNAQDAAAGYGAGSFYMAYFGGDPGNPDPHLYYCLGAAVGAATWVEILFAASGSVFKTLGQLAMGSPYSWPTAGLAVNGADADGTFAAGYYADAYAGMAMSVKTADATPTKLGAGGAFTHYEGFYVDGYAMYEGVVTAFTLDRADRRAWKVVFTAMADGSGNVTIDVATITDIHNTAGASAWSIAVVTGGTYAAAIEATGAAATNIAWSGSFYGVVPGTP
jgi:hypothetical protein